MRRAPFSGRGLLWRHVSKNEVHRSAGPRRELGRAVANDLDAFNKFGGQAKRCHGSTRPSAQGFAVDHNSWHEPITRSGVAAPPSPIHRGKAQVYARQGTQQIRDRYRINLLDLTAIENNLRGRGVAPLVIGRGGVIDHRNLREPCLSPSVLWQCLSG